MQKRNLQGRNLRGLSVRSNAECLFCIITNNSIELDCFLEYYHLENYNRKLGIASVIGTFLLPLKNQSMRGEMMT